MDYLEEQFDDITEKLRLEAMKKEEVREIEHFKSKKKEEETVA